MLGRRGLSVTYPMRNDGGRPARKYVPLKARPRPTVVRPATPARLFRADPHCDAAEPPRDPRRTSRSEEHTSELQSQSNLVCRLLLEKKKKINNNTYIKKKTNKTNT